MALMASFGAYAGIGGLNVQSHLGEPFSGTVTVTGEEAKALLKSGKATVSNSNLRTSVRRQGDKAIVTIRSSKPVQDPVLIFNVNTGKQSREYTAIIDPADYNSTRSAGNAERPNSGGAAAAPQNPENQSARERINRAIGSDNARADASEYAELAKRANANQKKAKQQAKYSGIQYGKRHLVRNGETVRGIANRIRPQGVSQAAAVQALMNANPGVFSGNNPDRMIAGKVLNIPTRAALSQAAAQSKGSASVAGAAAGAVITQAQTAGRPVPQTPGQQNNAAANAAAEKASAEKAAVQQQEQTVRQADKPEDVPQAGQTGLVEPASAASAVPPVQASAVVPASVAEPVETASQTAEPETVPMEESGGDQGSLWRWLLMGGAAVLAALLLLKLLGRKKGISGAAVADGHKHKEDDEVVFDSESVSQMQAFDTEPSSVKATAVTAAAGAAAVAAGAALAGKAKAADDELDMEDDFDDDIFFTDTAEQSDSDRQDNFNLDLGEIDNSQNGIVSSAVTVDEETEARRNADWDNIESTESVYEPDPEPYPSAVSVVTDSKPEEAAAEADALEFETVSDVSEPVSDNVFTVETPSETAENKDEALEFFTEPTKEEAAGAEEDFVAETEQAEGFDIETAETAEVAFEAEPLKVAETETAGFETVDGNGSSVETSAFFAEPSQVDEAAVEEQMQQDDALEFDTVPVQPEVVEFDTAAAQAQFAAEAEAAHTESEADKPLDFKLPETATAVTAAATVAGVALAANEASEPLAVESETEAEVGFATDESDDTPLFDIKQDEGFRIQDGEDFTAAEHVVSETSADETIDWSGFGGEDSGRDAGGFISESVGMTAPFEAKYELAKMYMEIGDPDTARETLQELIEEADGDIVAKAEALLKEIRG